MELTSYIGKRIKLQLTNNFLYEGSVIDADKDSLTIIDKFGAVVTLSNNSILFIREVKNDCNF